MKTIKSTNVVTGAVRVWNVPSVDEAIAHSKETHGRQYDPIERKTIEGGKPMVWLEVTK